MYQYVSYIIDYMVICCIYEVDVRMTPPPCIHVAIHTGNGKYGKARRLEIPQTDPDQHHFYKGAKIVITLESDPTIQLSASVNGNKRRFATISRKQVNSNHFIVGTKVNVTLDPERRDCAKCMHVSTPAGNQCYTMTRRLKELISDAGKPFTPEFVVPALDQIADTCKRYEGAI
jgi:hypothetical protein